LLEPGRICLSFFKESLTLCGLLSHFSRWTCE